MATVATLLTLLCGLPAPAQAAGPEPAAAAVKPEVREAVKHDLSGKLSDLPPKSARALKAGADSEQPTRALPREAVKSTDKADKKAASDVVQKDLTASQVPDFITNFEGVGNVDGVLPPDTNGDVGPNHYVQMVNLSYAVYDKSGTLLLGPLAGNSLFTGFGGPCETSNDGDPVVMYDEAADRWMLTQFALAGGSDGYHQCMAISQTPDPTGAYYRYDFFYHQSRMNDYPKYGIWPDAYYMTANEFSPSFAGAGAVAFEREKMLAGEDARMVYFHLGPDFGGLLPADAEGMAPPAGAPNPFVMFDDDAWGISATDRLLMWDFKVDWTTPENSTFGDNLAPNRFMETAPFDSDMCGYARACIPQQGSSAKLDSIPDRLMYRAAYRNFGDHASIVLNHTVDADGTDHAGVRWYELRSTDSSNWNIHQQGTYAPDAEHRWMGSGAMDISGNIAFGYSASGTTAFPSIRMAGRLSGDPLGELGQSERTLIAGTGAQTHSASRWGDYSSMSVDPTDGCTFWYANEYIATTSSAGWQTRIGSMKFPNCVAGPHGEVAGTVTSGGDPIAGASVRVGGSGTTTGTDGKYKLSLPTGEQEIAVTAFGYAPKSATVTVPDGGSVTADFALDAVAKHKVSGVVKDGSGHGWPLYARIDVAGKPGGPLFTDPATGEYSIDLPTGQYGLTVKAMYPSYQQSTAQLEVGDSDQAKDFGLVVENTCVAAGYQNSYGTPVITEEFETDAAPEGWSVVNHTESGGWAFTDAANRGNLTGGAGKYAIADSDAAGSGTTIETELTTPALDLSALPAPVLRFNSDYRALNGFADVEVSVDGGTTWATVTNWTTASRRGPVVEELALPTAGGKADVRVRFHYKGSYAWWWELDNVSVLNRSCDPVPGGLLVGQVFDGNTDSGLNAATVTSDDKPAEKATTATTPDDDQLGDGFYWMFSSLTGSHPFSGTKAGYASATSTVDVQADKATKANFTLNAGKLTVTPPSVSGTQTMGQTKTVKTTIRNTGNAPATVELSERRGGFEILGPQGAPLQLNAVKGGGASTAWRGGGKTGVPFEPSPYAPPWITTANYPSAVMDNAAAAFDGKVYSVGGASATANYATTYVYDPPTNTWTKLADLPAALEKPQATFVDGKMYVFGGWDSTGTPSSKVYAYDPATNAWQTKAAVNPAPRAAAGTAVVDGQVYLIGGCTNGSCVKSELAVRYNPATDAFTTITPYPVPVAWQGCGGINGTVYCAGGFGASTLKSTYAYNPSSNAWTQLADLPLDFWGAGADTANGLLLLSTGVINNSATVTNQGWAYDPAANSWSELPNANFARYRAGAACGFMKIGGSTGGFTPTADSELLPGFDACSTVTDVPWLSVTPTTTTLAPGTSATVTVKLDATAAAKVEQPGTYTAQLGIRSDTPYTVAPVNVTMNVTPPRTWGKLTGIVTGVDCQSVSAPLRGATVQVDGRRGWTYTLKADTNGRYAIWGPTASNPVQIIVARDTWIPQTKQVRIRDGRTVTNNFALRPITC